MGLLMFKERSPDDKTPFRRNEFHVKDGVSLVANVNQSQIINGRITRTTPSSTHRDRDRQRQRSRPSRQANRSSRNDRLQGSHPLIRSRGDYHPNTWRLSYQNGVGEWRRMMPSDASERSQDIGNSADHPLTTSRIRSGSSRHFAPARQFYEEQRAQYFDVTSARGHAQTSDSRSGSIEANNRRRAASPDTELAILRELRRQEDTENRSRLYLDGAADTSSGVPRMTISHTDGLGDRRRSPSPAEDNNYDNGSDENWDELTDTIPIIDANLPSAGSSFASDGASSILSRGAGRSSFTNTPVSDSRANDADNDPVRQQEYYAHYCPEGNSGRRRPDFTEFPDGPYDLPFDLGVIPRSLRAVFTGEIAAQGASTEQDREVSRTEDDEDDEDDDEEMATGEDESDAMAYTNATRVRENRPSRARFSRRPRNQSQAQPHLQSHPLARLRPISTTSTNRNSNADSNTTSGNASATPRPSHSSTDLSSLDELLDMMNNGTEVPPEMWTAIGITPHLAGLRLRSRTARRGSRMVRGDQQ